MEFVEKCLTAHWDIPHHGKCTDYYHMSA